MIWTLLAAQALAAAPATRPCAAREAVTVDLRAVARAPEAWFERCIRMDGFVSRNRFYADVGGYYASAANDADARRNEGWLGLYTIKRRWPEQLVHATVTGRLGSCERAAAAAEARRKPNVIIMLTGYCHYTGGLTLRFTEIEAQGPARLERLMGRVAREDYGDLIAAQSRSLVPPVISDLADQFIAGVRRGDGATLAELVVPYITGYDEDPARVAAFRFYLAGEGDSALAFLRQADEPQRAYFYERQSPEHQSFGYVPTWHVCFCRTADCSETWPISAIDSDATTDRPYVCVRTVMPDEGLNSPPRQLGIVPTAGLPEPA